MPSAPRSAPAVSAHLESILQGDVGGDLVQEGIGLRAEGRHLHYLRDLGQLLQPAALDQDPEANQAELAEDAPQASGGAAIAPVVRKLVTGMS
jgi:hypothetical protein